MHFSLKLARLRSGKGISQEKMADELGVSRQAVQKWESGAGVPEVENLIRLAKYFGVSLDSLLLDSDLRMTEEMPPMIQPDYALMHAWDSYAHNVRQEFRQSMEEGKDIAPYEALFSAVADMPPGGYKARMADVLYDLVSAAPLRNDYPYEEPSDLKSIFALRPKNQIAKRPLPDKRQLQDQIHGAWLGRICGCLLGKPIEGIRTEELHPLLKESGNWPMRRYIRSTDITPEMQDRFQFRLQGKCWGDVISCAPKDDDTNYTLLAQRLLDQSGRDFTPRDVGMLWLCSQPQRAYCTAERVAFNNLCNGYLPPQSAQYQNPYREWIGAQIRGDYFGYINPGDPETAAEMAWRDASVSHIKNGIYGEMFIAAMLAQAAVEKSREQVILAGLSQIPASSRLYESILSVVEGYQKGVSADAAMARIHRLYDEHSSHDWCHTISNAMIVSAALLYGGGEYGKSVCLAVQQGFDTDCNGATVGSVVGMLGGTKAISPEWTAPINDQLDSSLVDASRVKISEIAAHTMAHLPAEKI